MAGLAQAERPVPGVDVGGEEEVDCIETIVRLAPDASIDVYEGPRRGATQRSDTYTADDRQPVGERYFDLLG